MICICKYAMLPIVSQNGIMRVKIPWMKGQKGFNQYAKVKSVLDSLVKVIDIVGEWEDILDKHIAFSWEY